MADKSVIETINLGKRFGTVTALRNLTLTVGEAEVFGLLGPNGAGKTTSLRCIAGLLQPSYGEVKVLGGRPDSDRVRRQIGMLSETVGLYQQLSVKENLVLFGQLYGLTSTVLNRKLQELESLLELGPFIGARVWRLSTGQRKRAGLARTLLAEPRVMLLDEPWTGLDPISSRALRRHLASLAKDTGATVLICTHGLSDAAEICGRVGILAAGSLCATGTPESLIDNFSTGCRVSIEARLRPGASRSLLGRWVDLNRTPVGTRFKLEAYFNNEEALAEFVHECSAAGVDFYELRRLRPNLEDIYAKVIETCLTTTR